MKNFFLVFIGCTLLVRTQVALAQSSQSLIRPYLVLNQSKYIPGDTAWFKVYVLHKNLTSASGKHRIHINLVDNHGHSKFYSLVAVTDGIGQNQLPLPETIEPGPYMITAYLDGAESDEHFFLFKKELPIVSKEFLFATSSKEIAPEINIIDVGIDVSQADFHPRDKVPVQISIRNNQGRPVEAEFSVSVLSKELFSDQSADSFCLELSALFNGSSQKTKATIQATSNQQRLAQVLFNDSDKPVPDSTIVYFYLQRSRWRYQTMVGKNGWVRISLPDLNFDDEFFYLAELDGMVTRNIRVKWEERNVTLPKALTPVLKEGVDKYALYASQKKIVDQSFGFHVSAATRTEVRSVEKSRNDILPISVTIDIQDYDLFPTMQEYIKEIVPALFYRRRGGKDVVRVKLQSPGANRQPTSALNEPIYIIDGIATQNTDFFLSLKPANIMTIKIANDPRKLAQWGLFGKNGVLIIQTKKGNLREPINDPTKIFQGLSQAIPFRMIVHTDATDRRIPDFRSNLYWNPTLVTDVNGKATVNFFCSDDFGEFEISIQGITKNGQPFSAHRSIGVKP